MTEVWPETVIVVSVGATVGDDVVLGCDVVVSCDVAVDCEIATG